MSTYYEFYAAAEKDGKIEAIGPYRNVLIYEPKMYHDFNRDSINRDSFCG